MRKATTRWRQHVGAAMQCSVSHSRLGAERPDKSAREGTIKGRMRLWRFFLGGSVAVGLVLAQQLADSLNQAPPAVDQALRERVGKFYQAHVDGKFRQAEKYIAEDSQDWFYNNEKSRYISYEIVKIDYSDNFTKAKVMTAVELDWNTPRMGTVRVKPPQLSLWKVENGQWMWYIEARKDWESPWGLMKPGPESKGALQSSPPRSVLEQFKGVDVATVQSQVRVSKTDVRLSSYEPASDEVLVANSMQGKIRLALQYSSFPGLEIKLDKQELGKDEQAKITFRCNPTEPSAKPTVTAFLRVEPTNQVIPIRVVFAIPPAVEKMLPKTAARQ